MEKERKSLFGKLLAFWKEKMDFGETKKKLRWQKEERKVPLFAETGAEAVMEQEETKSFFWEEAPAVAGMEEISTGFLGEAAKAEKMVEEHKEVPAKGKRKEESFMGRFFWGENQKMTEAEAGKNMVFMAEPEEGTERRTIIPATEEKAEERKIPVLAEPTVLEEKNLSKEKGQTLPAVDIEGLMREMTKRLWEEREGCGRRLR